MSAPALNWVPYGSNPGFTYALQERRGHGRWRTLASRLTKPGYAFIRGNPEAAGTWNYRVTSTYKGAHSQPSPPSNSITVRAQHAKG